MIIYMLASFVLGITAGASAYSSYMAWRQPELDKIVVHTNPKGLNPFYYGMDTASDDRPLQPELNKTAADITFDEAMKLLQKVVPTPGGRICTNYGCRTAKCVRSRPRKKRITNV